MITVVSERPTTVRNRDLYLDALRTAAIVRIVTYHTFGGSWFTWAFPAMGMMFALAGGLMVRSLDRQPARTVVRNRFRRLLPALWLFGLIMIPIMIWRGGALSTWTDPNTGEPVPLWHLVYWVLPVFDPPGNTWGANATVVLWYLRTYLWLVALSPLLLKAFRRWPVPTLVLPLGIVVAQSFGVLPGPDEGQVWDLLSTLGMYAPCWMLGFAHRTGKLNKVPVPALLGIAVACAAGGAAWAIGHPIDGEPGSTYDLNGIPLAQALWSMAFIIPLLRFAPDAGWVGRTPFLGRFVALVNARAVTIYLWHNVMIDASFPVDDWLNRFAPIANLGIVENPIWDFVVIWILIAVAVVLFGWVEDFAARRTPRLFPVGPSAAQRRAAYAAERETERTNAAIDATTAALPMPAPVTQAGRQGVPRDGWYPEVEGQYQVARSAPAGYESGYAGSEYPTAGYPQLGYPPADRYAADRYTDFGHADSGRATAGYADPRHQGARHGEPRHGDPRHGDPRYREPRHGEPQHGDSRHGVGRDDDEHTRTYPVRRPSARTHDRGGSPPRNNPTTGSPTR